MMVEARQRSEWERTSAQMALLFNLNRDRRTQSKKPDDFNPYSRKAGKVGTMEDLLVEFGSAMKRKPRGA